MSRRFAKRSNGIGATGLNPQNPLLLLISRLLLILLIFVASPVQLAEASDEGRPVDDLADRQSQLANRYSRVEKLILRMAEFDAADNPQRSELLKKAFLMSKDRRVHGQLELLVEFLESEKLSTAVSNQDAVTKDLRSILELLLTENRSNRLRDEKRRIKDYIREIESIERMQRAVQGRTEGGVEFGQLSKEQGSRRGSHGKVVRQNLRE